jgi:hypothetical protein
MHYNILFLYAKTRAQGSICAQRSCFLFLILLFFCPFRYVYVRFGYDHARNVFDEFRARTHTEKGAANGAHIRYAAVVYFKVRAASGTANNVLFHLNGLRVNDGRGLFLNFCFLAFFHGFILPFYFFDFLFTSSAFTTDAFFETVDCARSSPLY